jgi:teichoic acid transport system permease protein
VLNRLLKYRNIFVIIALLLVIVIGISAPWTYLIEGFPIKLKVTVKVEHPDTIQLFYTNNKGENFSEKNSIRMDINDIAKFKTLSFDLPSDRISRFRIDTGSSNGKVYVNNIQIESKIKKYNWDAQKIKSEFEISEDIKDLQVQGDSLCFNVAGNNPYMVSGDISAIYTDLKNAGSLSVYIFISIAVMLVSAVYVFIIFYKRAIAFIKGIIRSKSLIFNLAKNDFKVKYAGSYLGIIWSFVQPVITILLYWFVFQIGFRSGSRPDGTPFIFWMICGIVPWFYFSEALMNATNCLLEYSYLVKKVVFQVSILPVVKIVSSLFIHMFFILFLFGILAISGIYPTIYTLQLFYYLLCMVILLLGIAWITSSLVVFLKDISQIINIVLQIGFWATPIVWSTDLIPNKGIENLFKLNPMFYIVQGYRDSFVGNIWFWNRYNQTIYFWIVTGIIFFVGAFLFKKLRPHFSDVL